MPRYTWAVTYNGITNVPSVQNITIQKGRIQIQDPFKSSTATVQGRNLSTFPNIVIGGTIVITATEGANVFDAFVGVVSDVQINYGLVPNMDTWTIQCEDAVARLGRSLTTNSFSWTAGLTTAQAAINTATNATGGVVTVSAVGSTSSTVSAQSLPNTNALQILNQLAATEQGYLYSLAPNLVTFRTRAEIGTFPIRGVFSDSGFPGPNTTFSDVTFRSQADSFFDEVVVQPEGLASQTSGSGPRIYNFNSYDQNTSQAKNLADYVLATLQVQTTRPSTISVLSETQDNNIALSCATQAGTGIRCALSLRLNTFVLFVEGSTITVTPDQARFTLNVVSADALNFFILDDASFGVLDTNKLGF
jgi:hypothetical protein